MWAAADAGWLVYLPWQTLGTVSPNSQTLFSHSQGPNGGQNCQKVFWTTPGTHSGTFPIKVARAYSVLYLYHFWPSNHCWDPLSSNKNVSWAATFNPGSKSDLSELTGVCFWGLINFPPYPEQLNPKKHSIERPVLDTDIIFLIILRFLKRKGIECNNPK